MKQNKISKNIVKKAGKNLRANKKGQEALKVLQSWRLSHLLPLSDFTEILKNITKEANLQLYFFISQRLKRLPTILNKLDRYPNMQLNHMQDIGGDRIVVTNMEELRRLEKFIDKARHAHFILLRKRDYITEPKTSGYRSIHYVFKTQNYTEEQYNDLYLELQIRTDIQHLWATTVEIIGTYLRQGLKFNQGEAKWMEFFILAASTFAIEEKENVLQIHKGIHHRVIKKETIKKYNLLKVKKLLTEFTAATNTIEIAIEKNIAADYYVLVLDLETPMKFDMFRFTKAQIEKANQTLIEFESNTNKQAVLVSSSDIQSLKAAYPNYFMDTVKFSIFMGLLIKEQKKLNKKRK